ncbi:tripartite-type tricarboxylate transporter receptor subunit TctC [Variovorax boronicumulans]|uniref:Tripartite-type tricarboxylate transporter receptor subunit TctC n=1 Tax=Variovorax boronicumulans TaxID=436515 RepID=A0AAW8DUH1_9BURK|nr:tripartite tricarboxylate transporter substrate binding protein [Variovorax boronicumulans]MDP9877904.1 tripartite-type tricarboxylate transporter receptor subunit TctC [Variovorax boronicumulans]MDP9923188.1 tripartite-type tricarboxylate transporter receptor subunit TctC [Variovorax boronicumulans]
MKKRHVLWAAAALALVPAAFAQPNAKPLRIVSSFSPGGPVDFVARALAEQLGHELKRPVIVENKPGANGALGAMETLRAGADGSTLWITSVGAAAVNPSLHDKLPYNTQRDFAPVSLVANNVEVFVIQASDPATDAAAFVKSAKADKASTPMASSGSGSIPHLALIQLEESTGARFLHVPYKGMAPAFTDLMGGQVKGVFADVAAVIPQVNGGRLKAVGIASSKRHPGLPQVKTFEEQGIKAVDTNNWYALFASAKAPAPVREQLNTAVRAALANPELSAKLLRGGAEPKSSSPQELAALLKADTAKWAALIKSRDVKADE